MAGHNNAVPGQLFRVAVTSARLQALNGNGKDEFQARRGALPYTPLAGVITYLYAARQVYKHATWPPIGSSNFLCEK